MREFTPLALILGAIIGVLFGAANAYIGMKVGMTISASIPAAVISMAVLRGLLKRGTLLENNMVQTIGSVGESLAAGMIFTIPALFIFAYTDKNNAMMPTFLEMTIWGAMGGLLGVLFMVPLRRMLIVKEHGKLPYPEGTACAEVLESGERGGASARLVFAGLGAGAIYEFFRGLGFWKDEASQRIPLLRTEAALATEPALLGVGYILGARIAGYMLAGAVLGWFVIIPAIQFFAGDGNVTIYPSNVPISAMEPGDMWNRYLRYVGAGAVVLGGVVSLFKSFGTIGASVFHMFGGGGTGERTDRDIPTVVLILLLVGLAVAMWWLPGHGLMNPLMKNITVIACVIGFGFFFVTVSSRLVGIVGSSSNPASGMTIATLLGTSLILVYGFGLTGVEAKIAIISVGAIVCISICIAGDCSQDLKTGFLVKATPWKQQVGELVGVLTATAALAGVIYLCNDRYGFFQDDAHPNALLAPQANIMKLLVEGIVDAKLPWTLILCGMACALIVELLGIPSLPFAVGLYLPLSLSSPIMVGGVLRWFVDWRRRRQTEAENPGILAASGLVAGQGLVGVFFVGVAAFIGWWWNDPRFEPPVLDESGKVVEVASAASLDDQELGEAENTIDEQAVANLPSAAQAEEPATAEHPPSGELVVPKHLYPWLTKRFDFLHPDYGIRKWRLESGAFVGEYAVDWYKLLPLVPFGLLTLWLAMMALKRLPYDDVPPGDISHRLPGPIPGVTPLAGPASGSVPPSAGPGIGSDLPESREKET